MKERACLIYIEEITYVTYDNFDDITICYVKNIFKHYNNEFFLVFFLYFQREI